MDITYLGVGSVRISGKTINVICDPYDESSGLSKISAKADVVLHTGPGTYGELPGSMLIDGPGDYEVKNATITGVPARLHIDESGQRGTVFSVVVDGINTVVSGNIAGKLDEGQIENLGQVDVLVLPVGGHGLTLDAEAAAEVVAQLEPSFVVPVHYDDGITAYPMVQDSVEKFLNEMGAKPEPQPKLRLTQSEAPTETQVVLLPRFGT